MQQYFLVGSYSEVAYHNLDDILSFFDSDGSHFFGDYYLRSSFYIADI